jgi:hypothetical protein
MRIVVAYTMSLNDKHSSNRLVTTEIFPAEQASKLIYRDRAPVFAAPGGPKMRAVGLAWVVC